MKGLKRITNLCTKADEVCAALRFSGLSIDPERNATLLEEKMARREKAMEKQELFKASDVAIDDYQVPPTPKINEQ